MLAARRALAVHRGSARRLTGAPARGTATTAHSWARRQVGEQNVTRFVHVANLMACCALCSEDMLRLRSFMIASSASMILYNLLQPTALIAPAAWASFFICGHGFQILRIFDERRDVGMTDREHALYEAEFLKYGFTPRVFADLLACAEWVEFEAGERLVVEDAAATHVYCVEEGAVDLLRDGETVRMIDEAASRSHRGNWIGDCYESEPTDAHPYTAVARSAVRAVRFDRPRLRAVIDASPAATAAAEKLEIDDLSGKLESTSRGHLAIERDYEARVAALQAKLAEWKADPGRGGRPPPS